MSSTAIYRTRKAQNILRSLPADFLQFLNSVMERVNDLILPNKLSACL